MRECRFCANAVEARDPAITWCRACHFQGRELAEQFASVTTTLERLTGPWLVEHTGGGCFWLRCPTTDRDDGPSLILTAWPDAFSGYDTLAEVEKESGFTLGAWWRLDSDDPGDWEIWGWSEGAERGLSVEALGMAATEALAWLKRKRD